MSYNNILGSPNLENVLQSNKRIVYLDARINPLLVSCVKKFGEVEGNNWREIIGVVLDGSNFIIGLLLHHVPDGTDLNNEETFGALTLLITEQAYQLFQGNRKISVCAFPNQETIIEVVTPDIMIPSYHNAYFKTDLLQPRAELVKAATVVKIANGCKRILMIVEDVTSDPIETLEHSPMPNFMADQFRSAVQTAARAVQHFNNSYFPITMRVNILDNNDVGQLQSNRDWSMKTPMYSMPCPHQKMQQIRGMASKDLQETDKYELKNLIAEKKAVANENEDGIIETSDIKKKLTIKLNEDNNEWSPSKMEFMNYSELFATADKLEWLVEQHTIAKSGKKLEPLVLTIDTAEQKFEDLLPESKTNIPLMFDDKKPETLEKSEMLIDVKSLNKLLENTQQEKSKTGKADKQKRRAQHLERGKALLDRAENLLDTLEKGVVFIPENKGQQLTLSLSDNSSTRKIKCFICIVLGLLTCYLFQIIYSLDYKNYFGN